MFIQVCFASEVASDAVQGSAEARAFGTAWVKVRGIDAMGAEQFEFKADLHAFSVPDRIDWPHLKKDIGCPYDCV